MEEQSYYSSDMVVDESGNIYVTDDVDR
ncbi:SBBP repeat-containing protein [Chloroflexus sp.]